VCGVVQPELRVDAAVDHHGDEHQERYQQWSHDCHLG
jgi:hypothetical protein